MKGVKAGYEKKAVRKCLVANLLGKYSVVRTELSSVMDLLSKVLLSHNILSVPLSITKKYFLHLYQWDRNILRLRQ